MTINYFFFDMCVRSPRLLPSSGHLVGHLDQLRSKSPMFADKGGAIWYSSKSPMFPDKGGSIWCSTKSPVFPDKGRVIWSSTKSLRFPDVGRGKHISLKFMLYNALVRIALTQVKPIVSMLSTYN